MNYSAASSGVSDDSGLKLFAASGGEFNPLRLNEVIEIAGTVNNTMNLNGFATNDVEYKVGFNNEDTIT